MDQRRKINKFTPFDRVLDGLEQEDLIDEDVHTKIIKVYSKKKNNKMFLLEKIITNEKDHLRYIDEIHKYEILQSEGLLNIEKWTYDMLIDHNLTKQYKFILVFDTYAQNLRQYLDTVSAKQLQLMREDIVNLFKVIIQSLAYMQQKNINNFNPVCMSSVVLCSDTNVKFNCIPLLMTPHSQAKAKYEAELYSPPEKYKNATIVQIYQQAVYSFGLIFIQIFLTRNVDNLNSKPEIVKQCLKELQQKYGDTYTKYLEGMVEPDPNKRMKLQDLAQIIQNSEPLKLSHNSIMSKISFSEQFEYFRKSYQIQGYQQIKSIATALPWTRFILLSNLFNIKNYFLELIDLQMSFLIAERATTILVGQFKVLIAGGLSSKHIYELDDEIPTLNQIAQFPGCLAGRWGFGYVIHKNYLYICSVEEYLYISPDGLQKLSSIYDPKDPHKNINWTTDYKFELPIRMLKSGPASLQPSTLVQVFYEKCSTNKQLPALSVKRGGKWVTHTYQQYEEDATRFAKSLIQLGLTELSAVNIIGWNAPEWNIAFWGSILGRYLPVGIYTTNNAEACFYVSDHSECELVVADNREQLQKFLKIWDRLPKLKAVVLYNDEIPNDIPAHRKGQVYKWNDFLELSKQYKINQPSDDIKLRQAQIKPGNCSTLIYTSGTTGNPKGVMLSHDNYYVSVMQQLIKRPPESNMKIVSYLPLSHVAAQIIDIIGSLFQGAQVYFAQPDALQGSLIKTLQEVRPSFFFSVPRVWEKIYEQMQVIAKQNGFVKTKIANWAKSIGKQGTFAQTHGQSPPLCFGLAQNVVYNNVKKALGLDQAKYLVFGAAPLAPQIREYFLSLNMYLINGYGMSECAAAQTTSEPEYFDAFDDAFLSSTGQSVAGAEIKIVNPDKEGNGEVCYRGRHVFMGYFKDENATRNTIDADRFLHSGDVGKLDKKGNLWITGRIKELIITAGGENVAPILIEEEIKKSIPIVSNAMVIGDARKFLTSILTFRYVLDKDGKVSNELSPDVIQLFKSLGSQSQTFEQASKDPKIIEFIQKGIDKANQNVISKAQNIRKWILVPGDFSVDSGELTPTLKLKRREVLKKWSNEIEQMYLEPKL